MEERKKSHSVKNGIKSVTLQPEVIEKCDSPELKDKEPCISVHPAAKLPIPSHFEEKENEILYLDPSVGEGQRILSDETTTISQLFAIMRQFVTPVCNNFSLLADEMRRRNVGINDVDAATGMTMLHYAVRAAALAERRALAVVRRLLDGGADPKQRCLYSDMNSLHIAAYFDLSSVCLLLLKKCDDKPPAVEVDSLCESFHFGTSLHVAASSLSCKSVEVLLEKGACYNTKDDLDRTPERCIPINLTSAMDFNKANHIREMLSRYSGDFHVTLNKQDFKDHSTKLVIGSRVTFAVNNPAESGLNKTVVMIGTLRYLGEVPGSDDRWAGVELDDPDGNCSGNIGNDFYFNCRQNHGLFVQATKVTPVTKQERSSKHVPCDSSLPGKQRKTSRCEFRVGDRVRVAGASTGTIRFIGGTQFAPGLWCGVELDSEGSGRNNGSVEGVAYFTCSPARGTFASPKKLTRLSGQRSGAVKGYEPHKRSGHSSRSPQADSPPQHETRSARFASSHDDVLEILSSHSSANRSRDLYRISSMRSSDVEPSRSAPFRSPVPKSMAYLRTGMRVDVKGTNHNAVIKYIGETDFSSGVWIGLDLGVPQGRNDGSVQGRRYFNCLAKHGIMLRPTRILYKGINGAMMVPPGFGTSNEPKK